MSATHVISGLRPIILWNTGRRISAQIRIRFKCLVTRCRRCRCFKVTSLSSEVVAILEVVFVVKFDEVVRVVSDFAF